jgi:hypothetical protein
MDVGVTIARPGAVAFGAIEYQVVPEATYTNERPWYWAVVTVDPTIVPPLTVSAPAPIWATFTTIPSTRLEVGRVNVPGDAEL